MPDMWMNVDAALSKVPVNSMPLIDDTDFKSREEGVTYDQAGLDLVWNFTTTAGVTTQTAVTPTEADGDYDWTNLGNGMYAIEIPASGGASANNDTEGFGWFSGYATGIMPWRGPIIGFRAAAVNDALVDGGDVLDVNLTELVGVAQSATDLKDFVDTGYDPTAHKVQGVVLADGCTSNSDMRGTDDANTTVPDAAGTAATLIGDLETHGDSEWVTATSVTVSDKTGFKLASDGMNAVTLPADIITADSFSSAAVTKVQDGLATKHTRLPI